MLDATDRQITRCMQMAHPVWAGAPWCWPIGAALGIPHPVDLEEECLCCLLGETSAFRQKLCLFGWQCVEGQCYMG